MRCLGNRKHKHCCGVIVAKGLFPPLVKSYPVTHTTCKGLDGSRLLSPYCYIQDIPDPKPQRGSAFYL
ncbi:unnamed protein product [Boreogadus saida]